MSFLLDTDICSAHLKGDRRVWHKMMQHAGRLHVSVITVGEIFTWVSRRNAAAHRRSSFIEFLSNVHILEVNAQVAEKFGEVRAARLDVGRSTPELDLLIASTAIIHGLTLVTHNTQDFIGLSDVVLQDWLAE